MKTRYWAVWPTRTTLITISILILGIFLLLSDTTVSAQDPALGWKVWVRTNPCNGNPNDGISVAKENPTFGGGGDFWQTADLLSHPAPCTGSDDSCTFDAAIASATTYRASGLYPRFCGSVPSGGDGGWKVWVKTNPCSGRTDWISVAKENPTYGGGGSFFYTADIIASGLPCTSVADNSCTFAAASAVAASIRPSDQFFRYCCRDSSVWRNDRTGALSVVRGKFSTASAVEGWALDTPDLCCEEAEAKAGLTGVCGSDDGSGGSGGGLRVNFIGCFKDPNNPFDLDGLLERSRSNTPQHCVDTCRAKGFAYAGVQYGESCLCGNTYGKFGTADNCNMPCTGDQSQICGGINSNSVYATGNSANGTDGEREKPKCPGTVRFANGIDPTCPQ